MAGKYPTLEQVENANGDAILHWYGNLSNPKNEHQSKVFSRVVERFIDLLLTVEIKRLKENIKS